MCGIAGLLDWSGRADLAGRARAMAGRLRHRGPDSGDVWSDAEAGIALGHRRLAVIDLTEAGHQPMVSACGRMVLSYNGEIYNAPELRAELEARGRTFRGHSDTEVIAEGAAEWGIEALLPRLIGMFAFAVWDRNDRRLTLVRDRFGIKPLYWGLGDGCLRFGSELHALRADPGFDRAIDRNAVAAFLRFGYVPAPQSIYRAARKLQAGHVLEIRPGGDSAIRPWWRLADLVREGRAAPFMGGEDAAVEALEPLLRDAVARRMIADVPLGVFLSGGIDSSTVAALMQAESGAPVKSFTIGFDQPGFDEAAHAGRIAAHLGTEHRQDILTPRAALEVIPDLTRIADEPFADPSIIPTWLVSRMTRQDVTVALSGDGGDEIFGGYNRYIEARGRLQRFWTLPGRARNFLAGALRAVPPRAWPWLAPRLPQPAEKAMKLARAIAAGPDGFYRSMVSTWQHPDEAVVEGPDGSAEDSADNWANSWEGAWGEAEDLCPDPVARMMYLDALTYMTDDVLAKVDRASMAVSLEVRVPLLDHRVAAFAWSLPLRHKIGGGQGKRLLRRVLERHVPGILTARPKQGFAMPVNEWLRGPLADWAGDLLSPDAIAKSGLLRQGSVQPLWQAHRTGRGDYGTQLWTVLCLQAFMQAEASP